MIRRHNCHSTSSDRNKTSESAFDMESESDLEKDLICNVESESNDDDTKINYVQLLQLLMKIFFFERIHLFCLARHSLCLTALLKRIQTTKTCREKISRSLGKEVGGWVVS